MHFQKPRNCTRQVRNKAHDSASGRFFCTLDIKATKRALAYGYITFKKHRKFGKSLFTCGTLPLRGFGCSCGSGLPSAQKGELTVCLAAWDVQVARNAAPVLNVDRNFIIVLVGGLAQADSSKGKCAEPRMGFSSPILTPPSEPTKNA